MKIREILVVIVILIVLALLFGCKDETEEIPGDIIYIDFAEAEGVELDEPEEETFTIDTNEPKSIHDPNAWTWAGDPNAVISSDMSLEIDFTSDSLDISGTTIYLKNMPLLNKDEIRDFAIVIGAATARLYACDEYYEGLLRLMPEKLLNEPKDD